MGIADGLAKCKVVNAPAQWARRWWTDYTKQLSSIIYGYGYPNGYQYKNNFKVGTEYELDAGKVYIVADDSLATNCSAAFIADGADIQRTLDAHSVGNYTSRVFTNTQKNIENVRNIRGLITVEPANNYIARVFGENYGAVELIFNLNQVPQAEDLRATFAVDPDTAKPLTTNVDNWIVPTIQWFYDIDVMDEGQLRTFTRSDINIMTPMYIHVARNIEQKWRTRESIGAVRYHLSPHSDFIATDLIYYYQSPPYVPVGGQQAHRRGHSEIYSRYVRAEWNNDGSNYSVGIFDSPTAAENPFRMFGAVDPDKAVVNPIALGNALFKIAATSTIANAYAFPAYPDIDSVKNLFRDFGIPLYENINEIYDQPPGDTEQGTTINPDPTDKPLPNYPDNTSDTIPIDRAYITPASFGNSNVYNPITTRNFLTWICDNTVNIDNWKRLFANPADVITGILLYNLDIVQHDSSSVIHHTDTNILGVSTEIPNYSILDGYNNIIDGGSIHLLAYYGNYSDFTNMTYQMFIPFVGFINLRACDVVDCDIHLRYAVDFSSGAAVAFVTSNDRLIHSAPCTVAGKIPLSISDRNQQTLNNTFSALGAIGGLVGGIASGNVAGGISSLLGTNYQFQTNYAQKGSMSSVNMFSLVPAFIERTRYDLFLPSNEKEYLGAAYQTAAGAPTTTFSILLEAVDENGYVECEFVKLNSSTATEEEQAQIISLLKTGVYL